MTKQEIAWRLRAAARLASDRITVRLRRPVWDRRKILEILSADVVDDQLKHAVSAGRWEEAQHRLVQRMRDRGTRFALDPASAQSLRSRVLRTFPGASADAARHADAMLADRFDLLGYRALRFTGVDGKIDWHVDPVHGVRAPFRFWADIRYLDPSNGDHKIIWELNRHQHWLRLGRALWLNEDWRYGQRMLDELQGWLAANPPLMGINWSSALELGFRTMSWTWALHFLLGVTNGHSPLPNPQSRIPDPQSPIPNPQSLWAAPWLVDLLVALDRQLVHIEENLSTYFSPNTHLTGEALALYVTGVALPELAGSRRWRDAGRRILLEEIARQIHPDGGHVERSTHYHRYTLDFYLMALLTAKRDGDAVAERQFADAATGLAEFALVIADNQGRVPLIGDDDGGMLWPFGRRECQDLRDSLATAAVLLNRPDIAPWGVQEETCWIIGAECDLPSTGGHPVPSRLLPDTGYAVMRNHNGSHAVFDVGHHGFLNGGHAHADALSITLTLDGRPLIIDPGTATYTVDARMRDRFRVSTSHNTLTIDGRSQSCPGGPFHWNTRADAELHGWRSHPHIDWAEASHDGYAPVRHRRSVLRTTEGWLVVDEVLGAGPHEAASHWHVDPLWALHADAPGRVIATHADGSKAWMLYCAGDITLARGDLDQSLGWHSPVYGAVAPSWTARVTRVEHAPFTMITWIGSPVNAEVPTLERVLPAAGTSATAIGATVKAGERSSVFLVHTGRPEGHGSRICHIGGYSTDARVFHCVEDPGTATRIHLIDTEYVRTPRAGISIESTGRIPELSVSLQDGLLDLRASQPPPELVIQVPRMRGVISVCLNQRTLQRPAYDSAETIRVRGADW